jgi:hypothetical protein
MEIETESRPSSVSSSKGVHVRQAGSLPPSRAVPARQIGKSDDQLVQQRCIVPLVAVIIYMIAMKCTWNFRNDFHHLL